MSVGFPSTTEMALSDWLDRVEQKGMTDGLGQNWRKKIAQLLHESDADRSERDPGPEVAELEIAERLRCHRVISGMEKAGDPVQDDDKYYALLLMDGDHMGRLVNGETLASSWRTVLHPELVTRLEDPKFDERYRSFWIKKLDRSRLLAPAVHAAISEALGDFALRSVPSIINKHRGQLIYAGGDDVCAVLPVSTVLEAARQIAHVYRLGFVFFPGDTKSKAIRPIGEYWQPESGRLAVHLGTGKEISISAGILLAHHKKPLSTAMHRAHQLLDRAKKAGGRNGFALELEKRSGGGRVFMARWDEEPFAGLRPREAPSLPPSACLADHFLAVGQTMGDPGMRSMSVSLAYRLEQFRPGLEAIIEHSPHELVKFLAKQLERSSVKHVGEDNRIADSLASLLARQSHGSTSVHLETESLIIAKFIGGRTIRTGTRQGG